MTAVLPPPDLRDRDGWHVLISAAMDGEGQQFVASWHAASGLWGGANDCTGHLSPEEAAGKALGYVAPLFPVPDDDAAVERVAQAMQAKVSSVPWGDANDEAKLYLAMLARAAIAAIRKGPDNG